MFICDGYIFNHNKDILHNLVCAEIAQQLVDDAIKNEKIPELLVAALDTYTRHKKTITMLTNNAIASEVIAILDNKAIQVNVIETDHPKTKYKVSYGRIQFTYTTKTIWDRILTDITEGLLPDKLFNIQL